MKKAFFLSIIIISLNSFCFSQNRIFKLNSKGFTPVITEVDTSYSVDYLYNKTIEWIQSTYKSPEDVMKGKVKNKFIIINGFAKSKACYTNWGITTCFDLEYLLKIEFKKGKYRLSMQSFSATNQQRHPNCDYDIWFKRSGKSKKVFKSCITGSSKYFNDLNKSLLDYINNKKIDKW